MRGGKEETKKIKLGRLEDGEKVASKERGKDKPETTRRARRRPRLAWNSRALRTNCARASRSRTA